MRLKGMEQVWKNKILERPIEGQEGALIDNYRRSLLSWKRIQTGWEQLRQEVGDPEQGLVEEAEDMTEDKVVMEDEGEVKVTLLEVVRDRDNKEVKKEATRIRA